MPEISVHVALAILDAVDQIVDEQTKNIAIRRIRSLLGLPALVTEVHIVERAEGKSR